MPTKPLIAIVDDDEFMRLALQSLIRSVGLAAEVFELAANFLAAANMSHVGCLILDVNMPGMSGLALHRQRGVGAGDPDDRDHRQPGRRETRRGPAPRGAVLSGQALRGGRSACRVNVALGAAGPPGAKPP